MYKTNLFIYHRLSATNIQAASTEAAALKQPVPNMGNSKSRTQAGYSSSQCPKWGTQADSTEAGALKQPVSKLGHWSSQYPSWGTHNHYFNTYIQVCSHVHISYFIKLHEFISNLPY